MSDLASIQDGAKALGGAVGAAVGVVDEIFGRIEKIRARGLSEENLLRAYYFEVLANLEILECLDFDALIREAPGSRRVRAVLSRIDNRIGETLLFREGGEEASGLFKRLEGRGRIKRRPAAEGRPADAAAGASLYEHVLQAISFTVIKTETLKRLAAFEEEELALLKAVQVQRRLRNLFERYRLVKRVLDGIPGIKILAR